MAELVGIAEAKAWIGITPTDTTRDWLLTDLAAAASQEIRKILCRDLERRSYTVVVNGLGGMALPLKNYPVVSVQSVTVCPNTGGLPLDPSRYTFDEHGVYLNCGVFPRGVQNIGVTYIAGFERIPMPVKIAARYTVKAMWDARLTDMNSTGESWQGVGGSSFWASGPGAVPPQALSLLEPYISHSNP